MVRLWEARGDGESEHAGCHARTAKHEKLATAETVNCKEGDKAREEFPGQSAAGEDARGFAVEAEALLENDLFEYISNVIGSVKPEDCLTVE